MPPEIIEMLSDIKSELAELRAIVGNESEWMNTAEAASYLGISEPTLRSRVKAGLVTSYRPGGKNLKFRRSDLNPKD